MRKRTAMVWQPPTHDTAAAGCSNRRVLMLSVNTQLQLQLTDAPLP
jgi:hypothetical protein